MKCNSPLKARIGPRGKDGLRSVVIVPGDSKYSGSSELPCGKCIGCRLAYSSE